MCWWSPLAMRVSADVGSPWLPVVMIAIRSGGSLFILSSDAEDLARGVEVAPLARHLDVVHHAAAGDEDPPPGFTAASMTCCTREISDAKVATMTRPWALAMIRSSVSPTLRSDGV